MLAVVLLGLMAANSGLDPARAAEATHSEANGLALTKATKVASLGGFCLNTDGNLLVCDAGARRIKVVTPEDKLVKEWKLAFAPRRIRAASDGSVYVGGPGTLVKLDKDGKTLKTAKSDGKNFPTSTVSGIAVTDKYVFASFGSGWSFRRGAVIMRFDRDLGQPKQIAGGLRCCCGRLDIAADGKAVYAAENSRFRIIRYDFDGKVLSTWGKKSRTGLEGFGSCCNPTNITVGPNGDIYTSESGLCRIKRYSAEGKFLGLIGEVGARRFSRAGKASVSCDSSVVAVSKDGKSVYVQDVRNHIIRVLKLKKEQGKK